MKRNWGIALLLGAGLAFAGSSQAKTGHHVVKCRAGYARRLVSVPERKQGRIVRRHGKIVHTRVWACVKIAIHKPTKTTGAGTDSPPTSPDPSTATGTVPQYLSPPPQRSTTPTTTPPPPTNPPPSSPPPNPPVNIQPPAIIGAAAQDATLTALTGTWTNSPTSYGYQWQDCPSTGPCNNIIGATDSQYTVQSSDVGQTVDVIVTATNAGGSTLATSNVTAAVAQNAKSYTAAAVGDIACPAGDTTNSCQQLATETLAKAQNPDAVFVLGDNQYNAGLFSEYTSPGAYNDTWGVFGCALCINPNPIVHPVPGNHEYAASSTAAGYFQYFGALAGPSPTPSNPEGYYSFNVGTWHIVALNSNCSDSGGCVDGVDGNTTLAQTQWLQSDLAANPSSCVLAMWHHPRFSWGFASDSTGVGPLWNVLYNAHADIILNAHDHVYERFTQQDPSGNPTPQGIREFVVGTGGESLFTLNKAANLEASDNKDFGVLVLTLHPSSYDWKFVATSGQVIDSGTGVPCHGPGPSGTASVLAARDIRAARTQGPGGPPFVFDVHPLHSSLTAAAQRGLPVAVYSSRAVDVAVTVLVRRAGQVRRITTSYETESEITKPYSLIYLHLPRGQLKRLRQANLVLRFAALDSAGHHRVVTKTVRLSQS